MIDFIKENWLILSTILISGLSFLIHLFQKRPKANSLFTAVDMITSDYLPEFILEAEKTGYLGEKKKEIVIDKCLALLKRMIKCDDEAINQAIKLFGIYIEKILATPRKKG